MDLLKSTGYDNIAILVMRKYYYLKDMSDREILFYLNDDYYLSRITTSRFDFISIAPYRLSSAMRTFRPDFCEKYRMFFPDRLSS